MTVFSSVQIAVEIALLGDSYLWWVEDIRQQEVKQSPQLVEVVLQWCTSQQQAVGCFEFSHNFWQLSEERK